MNNKLNPTSRLTIIFILAVVISGSILTYFSINNISNLKELTEKQIMEEQRELTSRFSQALQLQIEDVTRGFQKQMNPANFFIDSLLRTENKHDFIQQAFLLINDGTFLYPYFTDIPETSTRISTANLFYSNYRRGETAEFRENNFNAALHNYQLAIKYGKNANDSAKVLVALGRVSVKSGNVENAVQYYNDLILKYGTLSDLNGIPYVNFALQRFCKITDSMLVNPILATTEICLEKMNVGEIPLTYQTKEILTQFSGWIEIYLQSNHIKYNNIKELIDSIDRQIDFVYNKRNELTELVKRNDAVGTEMAQHSFFAVNPSTDPTELLLLNSDSINIWGFLIDGNKLFENILQHDFQEDLFFDYSLIVTAGYNPNQQYLSTVTLLNPYFNQQSVQIKLTNETALQEIIKKRSCIYGIASLLLLVAMFLGVYLILRDIAREKRLAQLRADFISNVTHELKTPLTSIYMFAESILLKRLKKESDRDEYLSAILKESERLKRMINNILEFSKSEKGKSDYRFLETNLAQLVNSAIQGMDYWFKNEDFEIVSDLDETIKASVDPEKMKQAFENILTNSVKYSDKTKKIEVRLYYITKNIHLDFKDYGIGIPENKQTRIFEKFYRIDQKESISGTGLGLTVVKEIVNAHNGKITVESEVGKGSKFSIILYH